MSPIIPHFTSECLSELNFETKQEWPTINKKLLEEEQINYVIQINGKKRGILNTYKDISEEKLLNEKTYKDRGSVFVVVQCWGCC